MLNQSIINYNKMYFSPNTLYYGDNLKILRNRDVFANEVIDLIYLDPPFNSKKDYNVLFKESTGEQSTAQFQVFRDSWIWDIQAKIAYDYLTNQENTSDLIQALHKYLRKSNMLAYLVMMGVRLLELHRVLKPTGSIFIHCDTTASHYLKLLMDSIFGVENFVNEIIWKRTTAHSGEGIIHRYGKVHDSILFYSKTDNYRFFPQYSPYTQDYIDTFYKNVDTNNSRLWMSDNLTAAGIRHGESGKPWRGIDPSKYGRHWKFGISKLDELDKQGRIHFPKKAGGVPRYKRYLDEGKGVVLQDIWTDINPISAHAKERLGFPTQKPIELLERIIKSCTKEGDLVLDPFCGCGTAIAAAENLHRRWMGIDITWLAINLVKGRLNEMFPYTKIGVQGQPEDIGGAIALSDDPYQFQWWTLSLINARPVGSTYANPKVGKKGADKGYDGWLRFADGPEGNVEKILVQVKSGRVGVQHIRDFRDVVITGQKAAMGIFITLLEPTRDMIQESKRTDPYISPRWNHEYPKIQILTIDELLHGKRPFIPNTLPSYTQPELASKAPKDQQQTLFM